jgi:hypothetical protein
VCFGWDDKLDAHMLSLNTRKSYDFMDHGRKGTGCIPEVLRRKMYGQ